MTRSAGLRRSLLALLALALGGCGFEPLYAERADQPSVTAELARIQVGLIPNRSGQMLRNYLLDELTPRGTRNGAYRLEVELIEPRQEVGIRRDDIPTRIAYGTVAIWKLSDGGGKLMSSGSAVSNTSYQIADSEFASLAALQAARTRVLEEIGRDIRQQLAAYFLETRRPRAAT